MRSTIEQRLLARHKLTTHAFLQSVYALMTTEQLTRLYWLQRKASVGRQHASF